jgi:hypothetical protein
VEAEAVGDKWLVDALRQHARNAQGLADVLDVEAKTHDREAARVNSDAQLAEARARSQTVRGRSR